MSLEEQNINSFTSFFVISHTLHCERIFTEDTFELDISTNLSTNISAPHHICAFHYWQSSFIRNILDCQLSDETSSVNTESWSLTDSSYQTPLNINIKSRNLPAKYSKYCAWFLMHIRHNIVLLLLLLLLPLKFPLSCTTYVKYVCEHLMKTSLCIIIRVFTFWTVN